jgi:hypothetical protein
MNNLPDLTITHARIENPNSTRWNLIGLIYKGGTEVNRQKKLWLNELKKLPIIKSRIDMISNLKEHATGLIESGTSIATVLGYLDLLQNFISYSDNKNNALDDPESITRTLYDYAEYKYNQSALKKIEAQSAYRSVVLISYFIKGGIDGLEFDIRHTRLKKIKKRSRRAIGREAEKTMLSDANKLARFCFEITQSFEPNTLRLGKLPIEINVSPELTKNTINLTPQKKQPSIVDGNFVNTHASQAFNNRVSAELMIYLAMTVQNIAPSLKLTRAKFDYKPLGAQYEIREYKNRRGGEVLFKIPKSYKPHFEKYLRFIQEYAPTSTFLFPFLKKGLGYRKRTDYDIANFKKICISNEIPWTAPRKFRKIGLNILIRLCSDEETSAEYANHGVAVFRQSYEFPSLQRAMIEVTRFWEKNDPLTHGRPMVSLFNTPCNGMPELIEDATNKLPQPDCISPTGCIGCKHYKDENSLDYVWNLLSFKYLKIIESSSHRTNELKPSDIAIDWVNLKINWFKSSDDHKHKEWVDESELRIEEGDYHPSWSRKIEKYEG